jgi:hypothetical protein
MPKKPTPDDLHNLLSPRTEPCISVYLPLPRHGPDLAKAPVRFRALLRQAEGLLGERYEARRLNELLAPLAGLSEASDVFVPGPDGLAAFRAEGLFEVYRLWPAPPERVVVADSFHVKPLLRCLQDRHRYFVLSLGSRRVALFEGSERGLVPQHVAGLPVRVENISTGEAGGRGGSPRGGPRSAGHGSGKAPAESDGGRREEQLRFFRAVEAALREVLGLRAPLVIAGAAALLPLFREVCGTAGLGAGFVEGAVDDVGTEELHARTLPEARKALDARDEALVAEFRGQLDRGLAADILTRVAEAAVLGRVRRLLVSDGRPLFGRVDRTTGEVTLHAGQTGPQDDDVLDDLAEIVLARGGEVVVLDPSRMPDEAAAVATFRW